MVPRVSYFHSHLSTIRKHFADAGHDEEISELKCWFSFDGVPLRWNYPVGLLFDIHADPLSATVLPWNIQIQFNDYPNETLIPIISHEAHQQSFMHTLKQADYIWNGTQNYLMALTKQEQQQLWDSLLTEQYAKFSAISTKVFQRPVPQNVPFRLFQVSSHIIRVYQDLFPPLKNESLTLVSDLIAHLNISLPENHPIVTHGISIPHETPLLWLCSNLTYPGHFLHIVIHI